MIEGLLTTSLRRIVHPKGDVLHALKRSAPGFVGFGEAYFSTVNKGMRKGWKRHRRVTLNMVVPVGKIRFVIYDDRDGSRTSGQFSEVTLSTEPYNRLTVAPGLWCAFEGVTPDLNLLLNIIDDEHDPTEADDVDLSTFAYAW